MRLYYVDYVNHMLKNYVHHAIENIQNEVDRTNWFVCDEVLREMPEEEKLTIWNIYSKVSYKDPKPLPAVVNQYCVDNALDFETVMNLVRRVTKQIKKERGL